MREFGGKGLFTKEIDEALLRGDVDMAVHSMKDLETDLPAGLCIAAILPRADVRDAFISTKAPSLDELPPGAVVGTSSLRRQAQVKRLRPDLRVVDIRGNVETRLKQARRGPGRRHAARARRARAPWAHLARDRRSSRPRRCCRRWRKARSASPAAAMTLMTRALLEPLNDAISAATVACERAFLARLDGSCKTPIAGLAEIADGILRFRGLILAPDGSEWYDVEVTGTAENFKNIGADAGEELRARAGPEFIASLV